jgi:hypothetical protein
VAEDKEGEQLELFPVEEKKDDEDLFSKEDAPVEDTTEDAPVEKEYDSQAIYTQPEPTPESSSEITGYRKLSLEEISWINTVKSAELELSAVVNNVKELVTDVDLELVKRASDMFRDAFMVLNRSIAKPEDPFA